MAGYFKTTKIFYRALWAWIETCQSDNKSPADYRMMVEKHKEYIHSHYSVMLGFIRAWPDMPELGELKPLFDKAKDIAARDDTSAFGHCMIALKQLRDEMLKSGLGGR